MRIDIYRTHEITDNMWSQIVNGYILSFENHSTTKEKLIGGYTSNHFGYSYHSVCWDEDKIVAFNSIIPYLYLKDNEQIKLGLSGTTYVLKEYRKDIFIFQDMYFALRKYCVNENVAAFLGVPNSNSYKYSIKLLKCKEAFKLSYYVLPVRIFNVIKKPRLSLFNIFSLIFSYLLILISAVINLFFNYKEAFRKYRLFIDKDFLKQRFAKSKYKTIANERSQFTYVLDSEDGVKVAYVMDFRDSEYRKSNKVLLSTVWHILRFEKVDMILYVGTMNMNQTILTKIPRKLEPKILPFTYNILDIPDPTQFESMSKSINWDFSLINLDVK